MSGSIPHKPPGTSASASIKIDQLERGQIETGKRILALWLPHFATERLVRASPEIADQPFATIEDVQGKLVLVATNPPASCAGLSPGMVLADARAFVPKLLTRFTSPNADGAALVRLAGWCARYTPVVSVVPDIVRGAGLFLDIAGCSHLFGGEKNLCEQIHQRLKGFGLSAHIAIADTAGAAWAALSALSLSGGDETTIMAPFDSEFAAWEALGHMPVAGLRIDAKTEEALVSFGLRTIADIRLIEQKAGGRKSLGGRFGDGLMRRLDQALGRVNELIEPERPAPSFEARRVFFDPIATAEDIARTTEALVDELCEALGEAGQGALRLRLTCYRVDGATQSLSIGMAQPSRWPEPLFRLLSERLEMIEPGFGIEIVALAVHGVAAVQDSQSDWEADWQGGSTQGVAFGELVDRLGNRLGFSHLSFPAPFQSWLPERAVAQVSPMDPPDSMGGHTGWWPGGRVRPAQLLPRPEPIEVVAPVPDDPPVLFRWHGRTHRVRAADGPERLCDEWWRSTNAGPDIRDYYRVEDEDGQRYWLYRAGLYGPDRAPEWFLHGVFG